MLRNGLIEAIGTDLEVPDDSWRLDLSGQHVYPGLIDALWPLDRTKLSNRQRERSRASQTSGNNALGLKSHVRVADSFRIDEREKTDWRDHGILSLNLSPGEGIFQGQTALIALSNAESSKMIVSSPAGMKISLRSLSAPDYPASLLGVMAFINQSLLDARHYRQAHQRYSREPQGLQRPKTDLRLQALSSVVTGTMPLLFPAARAHRIHQALKISREHQAEMILVGGYEAASLSNQLKEAGIPVLVGLDFPEPPEERKRNPYLEHSLRELRYRKTARKVAARLHEEEVPFAFASAAPIDASDFVKGLRTAIEHGLEPSAALRAATLSAAEILGVGDRLGSIEEGKIANLIVTDRDLFSEESKVQFVFVDGERYLPRPEVSEEEEKGESEKTPR